jgi:hypothetical protein
MFRRLFNSKRTADELNTIRTIGRDFERAKVLIKNIHAKNEVALAEKEVALQQKISDNQSNTNRTLRNFCRLCIFRRNILFLETVILSVSALVLGGFHLLGKSQRDVEVNIALLGKSQHDVEVNIAKLDVKLDSMKADLDSGMNAGFVVLKADLDSGMNAGFVALKADLGTIIKDEMGIIICYK